MKEGRRAARAVVLHAPNPMLPLTLSWTPADQSPGALRTKGGGVTAKSSGGVEFILILVLPARFLWMTALPRAPLGTEMPTTRRRLYAAEAYGLRKNEAAVCVSELPLVATFAYTHTDDPPAVPNASRFLLPARLGDEALVNAATE